MKYVKTGLVALIIAAGILFAVVSANAQNVPSAACCLEKAKCCCSQCDKADACQDCSCLESCKKGGCGSK
ncbi:MAG: hypothetical protein ABIE84_02735 [bacterium]